MLTYPAELACGCRLTYDPATCNGYRQNYTSNLCEPHQAAHLASQPVQTYYGPKSPGYEPLDRGTWGANEERINEGRFA